jgi:hypothetical protein
MVLGERGRVLVNEVSINSMLVGDTLVESAAF